MTTSADESALLAAIAADLEDDTVRLAYADFLDEHGDAAARDRAELIRTHFQIREIDSIEHTCSPNGGYESTCPACGAYCESERLHNRESELLSVHPEWTRWPCPECKREGRIYNQYGGRSDCPHCGGQGFVLAYYSEWDRGFPGWVTLPTWAGAVREVAVDGGHPAPIQHLWEPTPRLRALAKTPPWGVPLRGVRIGEAKPDERGKVQVGEVTMDIGMGKSYWWWRQGFGSGTAADLPSVIFNELNHPRIHTHNGNNYPTERAALDDLARAVLEFGRRA